MPEQICHVQSSRLCDGGLRAGSAQGIFEAPQFPGSMVVIRPPRAKRADAPLAGSLGLIHGTVRSSYQVVGRDGIIRK